jgi:hypothetical protein
MKKLFLMLSLVGATFFGFAQETQTPAPDPNAAEIKWDNTTIDYGTIKQDADGNRVFTFKNVGKSELIISRCQGSCGCTVPTCPTVPVLPGQKGEIKVHYDTHRVGPFTKTVTVMSNAKNANETLKITGTILDPNAGQTQPAAPAAPANGGH